MSFEKLGLKKEILAGVIAKGYTTPTPIQEKAIPVVLSGSDILAGAQTGTGKTAAFTLPLLHILSTRAPSKPGRQPRALVLAPTRELAAQVAESVSDYGQGLNISSTVIFGGVGIGPQKAKLNRGIDIVIGTPGRLLDLASQKSLDLSRIEVLILDEADRMLDMGFIHDIRKIIKMVPRDRQTLFFSATYSKDIKKLSDTILVNPKHVEVSRQNTAAENVTQSVYHTSKESKRQLLVHLINEGSWEQVLVFTKTKHGANRLTQHLERAGITAAAIHGNKSQSARTRALKAFKDNDIKVLVATDIAARGIDIDKLPHVVNYELPHVSEDYVHRIGRTGRAGSYGEAISLVCKDEIKLLRGIERLISKKIETKTAEGFTFTPTAKAPREQNQRDDRNRGGRSYSRNNERNQANREGRSESSRDQNHSGDRNRSYRDSRSESSHGNNHSSDRNRSYRDGRSESSHGNSQSNDRSRPQRDSRSESPRGNSQSNDRNRSYRDSRSDSPRGNSQSGERSRPQRDSRSDSPRSSSSQRSSGSSSRTRSYRPR